MQQRPLGSSGIRASVVALGAWAIGGWRWGPQDDQDSIRTIHAALDAGINFIDTAPAYGFGRSETIVGQAIHDRREQVVLATKCGLLWEGEQGVPFFTTDAAGVVTPDGQYTLRKFLGPESVVREVEASLKRLNTDYIDLLQTHWQDDQTAIEDTMAALVRLRDAGKIRAIGVCNATVEHIQRYQGAGGIVSDQERYSMLDRKLEAEQIPFCRQQGLAFLAYSPLAHGLLTGKVTAERSFGRGDLRAGHPRFTPENLARVQALLDALRPIAARHNVTLAQLVIAWTVAQPGVTHALVGARRPEQALQNAVAGAIVLGSSDLAQIDEVVQQHAAAIV